MAPGSRSKKSKPVESEGEEFSDVNSGSGSDNDANEKVDEEALNWVCPVVGNKANRQVYDEALKEAQLKVGELQMMVRKLLMRNAELSTELKNRHKTSKGKKREQLSESEARISRYAKLFGVMHEPFVPDETFGAARPAIDSIDPRRYQSDLSRIEGTRAELYELLPEDLHDDLKSSEKFRKFFVAQMAAGRRSMIHQLRNQTGPDIFSHSSKHYSVNFKRENLPEFQAKLRFPDDAKYKKFAPVLYPDGQRNMKKLFKCVELTKMLKSILFGPTSLHSNRPPSRVTQGKTWGTAFVTPGAIAHMAILAIFLHSPDRELADVGARSSIPYKHWFEQYKKLLMDTIDTQDVRNLFKWWNGRVFTFGTEEKGAKVDNDESSGIDEAVKGFNEDSDAADDIFLDSFNNLNINSKNQEQHSPETTPDNDTTAPPAPAPGPSDMPSSSLEAVEEQQPVLEATGPSQTAQLEQPSTQNAAHKKPKSKGKQKAANVNVAPDLVADGQGETGAAARSLRSRRNY